MSDSEKPKSWRERRKSIKHKWLVPLIFCIEWPCEWISYWLKKWAFLDILARLGHLAIVVAVIFYIKGCPERQRQAENQLKAKHYQAWQVINAAQGQRSSSGRIDALQDLNADKVSLVGLDISKAYLPKLNLENADLMFANLAEARLSKANLAGADFRSADLTRASLVFANLAEARLNNASLTGAFLSPANLAGAYLRNANLNGANLDSANLVGADLHGANLAEANLMDADLMKIKHWQKIQSIELANIYDVNNPPDGFIEWAIEQGAVSMKGREFHKFLKEKWQERAKEKQ